MSVINNLSFNAPDIERENKKHSWPHSLEKKKEGYLYVRIRNVCESFRDNYLTVHLSKTRMGVLRSTMNMSDPKYFGYQHDVDYHFFPRF